MHVDMLISWVRGARQSGVCRDIHLCILALYSSSVLGVITTVPFPAFFKVCTAPCMHRQHGQRGRMDLISYPRIGWLSHAVLLHMNNCQSSCHLMILVT